MSLENFDNSYWLLKDKEWVAQRKKDWLGIESYFHGPAHKASKAKTILKRYFLKGDLPDYKALQEWQSDERHLDLFCLLWLHPSWDKELLTQLRDNFVSDLNVGREDVLQGVSTFNDFSTIIAGGQHRQTGDEKILNTGGHNQLLFEILIDDKEFRVFLSTGREDWNIQFKQEDFGFINDITRWLKYKNLNKVNQDCLYQYQRYLEYWATGSGKNKHYFEKKWWQKKKGVVCNALVRIVDFDIEKEGDSPRTRSVLKLLEIMDKYDFIPEVKEMWAKAKEGTLETKGDPWK